MPASTEPALTIAEAVTLLDPPLDPARLAMIVRGVGLRPCGARRTGKRGHPRPVYPAADLMGLHAAIARWITISSGGGGGRAGDLAPTMCLTPHARTRVMRASRARTETP